MNVGDWVCVTGGRVGDGWWQREKKVMDLKNQKRDGPEREIPLFFSCKLEANRIFFFS